MHQHQSDVELLATEFPHVSREYIQRIYQQALAEYADRPVQNFVAIFAKKDVRDALSALNGHHHYNGRSHE